MASSAEDLSQFHVSNEEKDKLVAEVIRYVLFKTHQSSGTPIKREELTQIVTKNYHHRSLPGFIIDQARDKLASIFGYEMRELQRARPSTNQPRSSQQSVVEVKSYVVMSKISADVYKAYVEDPNTSHLNGFTFAVIGIVYVAGGKITEENLWHQLRRLGLDEDSQSHPVLGDPPKKLLEELVDQRYLQKYKMHGPEGNSLIYELAERALDGPISEKLKSYVSEVGKRDTTYDSEEEN